MGILSSLKESFKTKNGLNKIKVAIAVGIIFNVAAVSPLVAAVDYNAEIKKLEAQNNSNAATRSQLEASELTLEQKVTNLQSTILSLESQIRDNEADQIEISGKITKTEAEIGRQQGLLGATIRRLYIENDVTMLEQVASSKNLSEFVEKEQYNISVQAKIKQSLDKINKLKQQLQQQRQLVEKLLADSKAMQSQITAEKQELDKLLSLNQQQQASYTQEIVQNNSKISTLQQEQAEENARFIRQQTALASAARKNGAQGAASPPANSAAPAGFKAVSGTAYPWASVPFPNEQVDPWGMYKRQCVSYTAWKVAASGRHMPYWGGRGNAKQWDDNARAAGIPVDGNPRVGDVAVRNAGTYGHVMYVDAVHGDGSISISQYNASWTGTYSEARIFPGDLVFIHF